MIKQGIIDEDLSVDSHVRRENGSCPPMPEEVCFVLYKFCIYTVNSCPIYVSCSKRKHRLMYGLWFTCDCLICAVCSNNYTLGLVEIFVNS